MALIRKTITISSIEFTHGGTPGNETTTIIISASSEEDTLIYELKDLPNAAIKEAYLHLRQEALMDRTPGIPAYDEPREVNFDGDGADGG